MKKKTIAPDTSHRRPGALSTAAAAMAMALSCAALAAKPVDDESDLPETVRSNYVAPIDGPADNTAYARGALGLVRNGYGRASLFVAWRVMHLPAGALAAERHDRLGSWLRPKPAAAPERDEVADWLQARGAVAQQAPAVAPSYFRTSKKSLGEMTFDVETGHCGPDAYAFATRTLRELAADASWKDADRRAWVAGQDAVFARCAWIPGKSPAPALPAAPPARAPEKLKALHAYQRAAALFYGDEFAAARREFDAIAAVPGHPMRAWAVLGALRSLVREAVSDKEWDAAVEDAWTTRGLRGAEFSAAVAGPSARRRARFDAALQEFNDRAKPALADASLAAAHPAISYTARRAYMQMAPVVPLRQAMTALNRPEYNPYEMGALDLFQELYPQVLPDRPEGEAAAVLRQQHAWFDFVVAVQGCDAARLAAGPAVCDAEHAHALARWQETKDNAWLLAALMTARSPSSSADLAAAQAARLVPAGRPEWASLQFHAAKVLKAQGRGADARAALDALVASPAAVHKRDRAFVDAERRAL